ncbi:MAG: hypothetical protein ACMUIG_10035 [Thermoplasmatota archaeon]
MTFLPLSDNERRVMLSIMKNPEHSDKDLSESIEMNLYTFNKIKNALGRKDLMRRYIVPNYNLTGFELMAVTSGRNIDNFLNPSSNREFVGSLHKEIPTRFLFTLMEHHQGLGIHALEDYTSLKRGLQMKQAIINRLQIKVGEMSHTLFSFRDADFPRFFDLEPLMERVYGEGLRIPKLEPENPAQRMCSITWRDFFHIPAGDRPDLDELSRKVLLNLVKYPDRSDKTLSEDLGISRYKARKIREELFVDGFVKTTVIPNYFELGFKVIMFAHFSIRNIDDVREFLAPLEEGGYPRIIFLVMDELEGAGMGLFPDLEEATRMYQKIQMMLGDSNAMDRNPTVQMISLPNCDIKSPFFFSKPLEHMGCWDIDVKALQRML